MKKYFQLRICKTCDEQKMVNADGECKKCATHKFAEKKMDETMDKLALSTKVLIKMIKDKQ